jgi:hypothetical protein
VAEKGSPRDPKEKKGPPKKTNIDNGRRDGMFRAPAARSVTRVPYRNLFIAHNIIISHNKGPKGEDGGLRDLRRWKERGHKVPALRCNIGRYWSENEINRLENHFSSRLASL